MSSILIFTYYRQEEHHDDQNSIVKSNLITLQRFPLMEVASELQITNTKSDTSLSIAD